MEYCIKYHQNGLLSMNSRCIAVCSFQSPQENNTLKVTLYVQKLAFVVRLSFLYLGIAIKVVNGTFSWDENMEPALKRLVGLLGLITYSNYHVNKLISIFFCLF